MTKDRIQEIIEDAQKDTDLAAVKRYQVLNDHCVVLPVDFKEQNVATSGLVNPTQYEDKNEYGVILATGPGRTLESGMIVTAPVQFGDVVLYGPYSYTSIRVHGTDLNLIRHDDIIAVLPQS
jgi:chaperonin GroES